MVSQWVHFDGKACKRVPDIGPLCSACLLTYTDGWLPCGGSVFLKSEI